LALALLNTRHKWYLPVAIQEKSGRTNVIALLGVVAFLVVVRNAQMTLDAFLNFFL
jgi:hypothetical protein